MTPKAAWPAGFLLIEGAAATLAVDHRLRDAVLAAGLDDPANWERRLDEAAAGRRGTVARLELAGGPRIVLKALRRGGRIGSWWRERHLGLRRLVANLTGPIEARRRGLPTPAPVALLLRGGPPGFWRGWLATEEIAGARSLIEIVEEPTLPVAPAVDALARTIRAMHDRGVDHRDLNVANLLVAPGEAGPGPWIVDLDRARFGDGPLRVAARARALRRLERSTVKRFGAGTVGGVDIAASWYRAYAGNDATLAERLERARRRNRRTIARHARGWAGPDA